MAQAAQEVHQFSYGPLSAHSFNADRTSVAISCNSNEIQIQQRNGPEWVVQETLSEHDKLVTSIDWAPYTNRIVTCSQDRNAYVWNLQPNPENPSVYTWQPTLVLLRLNRSATYVRWSPNEQKFAVASGARTIAVCQFDEESNWWVAKHLKKPIRSTVLSLDWHPNSVLIAAGAADAKARVFSAFLKGADQKPAPSVWGEKLPFNTLCGEFASPSGGWVHSVAFSPSGDAMAFASHDSTVSIIYPTDPSSPAIHHQIHFPSLPLLSLLFTAEDKIVAAGHDCQPFIFQGDSQSGWKTLKSLDEGASSGSRTGGSAQKGPAAGRLNTEAFNLFKAADSRGVSASQNAMGGGEHAGMAGAKMTAGGTELTTVHQNTITSLRVYDGAPGQISRISSSGVDGRLVVWDVNA